jgi:hypothetical protein
MERQRDEETERQRDRDVERQRCRETERQFQIKMIKTYYGRNDFLPTVHNPWVFKLHCILTLFKYFQFSVTLDL